MLRILIDKKRVWEKSYIRFSNKKFSFTIFILDDLMEMTHKSSSYQFKKIHITCLCLCTINNQKPPFFGRGLNWNSNPHLRWIGGISHTTKLIVLLISTDFILINRQKISPPIWLWTLIHNLYIFICIYLATNICKSREWLMHVFCHVIFYLLFI